jgi:23S rRNA pseudouridine2605 synthase
MTRRLVVLLLGGAVLLAGWVAAQEAPPDEGEAPLRLKKKRRPGEPPPKADASKPGDKDRKKTPPKDGKAKEDEPLDPEDGKSAEPEEDEKELLQRVARNMRSVEEQLANRELGEPTRQKQRDILHDLDKLINRAQRPQDQDQQQGQDQSPSAGGQRDKQRSQARQGGPGGQRGSRGQMTRGQRRGGQRGSGRQTTRTGRGSRPSASRPGGSQPQARGGNPRGTPGGTPGNRGGAGAKGSERDKDPNADLYKEEWGHLPQTMRAEMNVYSNPQPFLPRYDDLIKKYYRTIAEQGRKKGD